MEEWVETGQFKYVEENEEDVDVDELQQKSGKIILENWLQNIKNRIDHDK